MSLMETKPFIGHEIKPLDSNALVTRIGGLPRGFDYSRWPSCKTCQRPQQFLLQLDLWSPARLATKHRWAFVFACDDAVNCEPFLEDSGANAVIMATDKSADAAAAIPIPQNTDWPTSPERHVAYQPWTDDEEEWLGAPELYLGITPNCQFEGAPSCGLCESEMNLVAQLEYDGSPCIIMLCQRECTDDAAYFIWCRGPCPARQPI